MPTAAKNAAAAPGVVGETAVARDFYAGRYARIVRDTFDAPSVPIPPEDLAFVIGALTFVGRVDDAFALHEASRRSDEVQDARTVAAGRFFLGLALARSGDFAKSKEMLAGRALERVRVGDPWASAIVFQGLACQRYFTGRYRAAARHALRALRSAHAARFAYAQMLSTDLRGHALIQLGQFQAGTALLEQAKVHAERLGFSMNAHAIECSIAVYKSQFKTGSEALLGLEALLPRTGHDSYSKRTILAQTAVQYAMRGRGHDAARALESADHDALRVDGRRAKVGSLLARLHVTRFTKGARACAELLDQAASLMNEGDVAFRAELCAIALWTGRSLVDPARIDHAERALEDLMRGREHHLGMAALGRERPDRVAAFVEDEVTPLLAAAAAHDTSVLPKLLSLSYLGLIPETLGLEPGRRVHLFPRENVLVVEDHGDLFAHRSPPRWVLPLLRLLGRGAATKEAIVAELWGLKRYHPDKHDPLVRTTIHRLRSFLEPRGGWLKASATGYELTASVSVVGPAHAEAFDPAFAETETLDVEAPLVDVRAADPVAALDRAVLETVVRVGLASVPQIAKVLAISESTALRSLRRLVAKRRVVKRGAARATRYRAR